MLTFIMPSFIQAQGIKDADVVQAIEVAPSARIVELMREEGYEPDQYKTYVGEESAFGEGTKDFPKEIQAVPSIVIKILELIVGYIIDGTVIVLTGKSTGEWAADAVIWVANGLTDIVEMAASRFKIERAYNRSGCIQYRPKGPWVCPY